MAGAAMLRRFLSITILVGFLIWVAWYVRGNIEAFAPILDVTWLDGLNLTLAFLAIMIGNGLFISIVSSALGIRLTCREYTSLSFASSFANFFLPFRGGAGIRALYMSRMHSFPVAEFLSTLSIMYLMHSVINGLLALTGMGLIAAKGGPVDLSLTVFFGFIVVAGSAAMFIDFDLESANRRFPLAQLARFTRASRTLRGDRQSMFRLWLLMLAMALATVWQCRTAFHAISIPLPWAEVFVYAASKNLATLIGLTPGALGVVELVSIYLGSVLGYTTADALSVQGLIRAVAIVVLLLAGPFAILYLRRRLAARAPLRADSVDA